MLRYHAHHEEPLVLVKRCKRMFDLPTIALCTTRVTRCPRRACLLPNAPRELVRARTRIKALHGRKMGFPLERT
jgi:hypothetical protein